MATASLTVPVTVQPTASRIRVTVSMEAHSRPMNKIRLNSAIACVKFLFVVISRVQ